MNNESSNNSSKSNIIKFVYQVYKKIAETILYAILIILIVAGFMILWYFIDITNNIKNGVNKPPIFGTYVIISPSMHPTIKVQDVIIIKRKKNKEYKIGDIITFESSDPRYSGVIVTHRIVGKEKVKNNMYYFRTKGDNNNTEDNALVKPSNIYGKVIIKIPKLGYLKSILTTSVGWILFIVIPCMSIVVYDLFKLFKSMAMKVSGVSNEVDDESEDDNIDLL